MLGHLFFNLIVGFVIRQRRIDELRIEDQKPIHDSRIQYCMFCGKRPLQMRSIVIAEIL